MSFLGWWEEDTKTQGIDGLAQGDKGIGMLVWLRSPQISRLQRRSGRHSQIMEGTRRRNTDRTRQGRSSRRTERTRAYTVQLVHHTSCCRTMFLSLSPLCASHPGNSLPVHYLRLLAPPLQLLSAAVWQVVQQGLVDHYGMLEEFVTMVTELVPELMSYSQRAQLIMGLRAKVSDNPGVSSSLFCFSVPQCCRGTRNCAHVVNDLKKSDFVSEGKEVCKKCHGVKQWWLSFDFSLSQRKKCILFIVRRCGKWIYYTHPSHLSCRLYYYYS